MAPLRAHARAASISPASSIQKPPMCSLVSVYGPSVTSTVPSGCLRTVFAVPAGEMPQANFLTPAAIISRLSAWISSIIASVTADGAKSSGRELATRYCGMTFFSCFLCFVFNDSFPVHPGTAAHRPLSYSRSGDQKSTANPVFLHFYFQLPNPLPQELPLWSLPAPSHEVRASAVLPSRQLTVQDGSVHRI